MRRGVNSRGTRHGDAISMERYSCRWNAIRCSGDVFGTIVAMQVWRFEEEKICRGSDDGKVGRLVQMEGL
jgi:hypothetical protein